MKTNKISFFPKIESDIKAILKVPIAENRKPVLNDLINYIRNSKKQEVKLIFICTHNSRRSQLAQVWAKTAAEYYDVKVDCFSGGTEATAFNKRAVAALERAGFLITSKGKGNPLYQVFYSDDALPIIAYSKLYDDKANPTSDFAAVMTCSDADANCPFIPGAEIRIPLNYNDPKEFDDTPKETAMYDERSLQIASEMFYVFSRLKINQ